MAVAAWLVWLRWEMPGAGLALLLFLAQLGLNCLWSLLFFSLESPGPAVAEILVLWCAIAATIAAFWPVSRVAAALMVPYLAWVGFAAALNVAIWRLNR
jgi:tryptophan-rich sensory protein